MLFIGVVISGQVARRLNFGGRAIHTMVMLVRLIMENCTIFARRCMCLTAWRTRFTAEARIVGFYACTFTALRFVFVKCFRLTALRTVFSLSALRLTAPFPLPEKVCRGPRMGSLSINFFDIISDMSHHCAVLICAKYRERPLVGTLPQLTRKEHILLAF